MQLRRARVEDAETIAELYLASRDAAPMPPGIHPFEEVCDHTRRVLPDRNAWLAYDGEDPVGVLILEGPELHWLFIHPSAQGCGIGTALLDLAKAEQADGLALWVFVINEPARKFYEDRGFAEVRRTDGDNEEGAPDIRYTWGNHPEALQQAK